MQFICLHVSYYSNPKTLIVFSSCFADGSNLRTNFFWAKRMVGMEKTSQRNYTEKNCFNQQFENNNNSTVKTVVTDRPQSDYWTNARGLHRISEVCGHWSAELDQYRDGYARIRFCKQNFLLFNSKRIKSFLKVSFHKHVF